MPEPVELLSGAVKRQDTIEISWRFKANFSELPPEGIILDAPESVPLPGSWQLELFNSEDDPDKLNGRVCFGKLPVGVFGNSVAVKIRSNLLAEGEERRLSTDSWLCSPTPRLAPGTCSAYMSYCSTASRKKLAASGRWPTGRQTSAQQYNYSVTLLRNLQLDTAHAHSTPIAVITKAQRLIDTLHTRHSDVRLRFGRRDDVELELWTTSGLLATASDYYKTLLASGCAETVPTGSKRQRSEAPPRFKQESSGKSSAAQSTIDWQDSDDETDDFLVEHDWSGCKTAKHHSTDLEYQQIDVRETAYSTMSAVLLYLMTGHIDFAPLSSLLVTLDEDGPSTRRALLDTHVSEHPTLPPPVTPKSVYRLAHLLQREELQQLALDALSNSLTIEGAARELFSPVSIAYTGVRKIVLDYVVKNWEEVQASESWVEMSEKAMAGEIEGAAQIPFDLLKALHGKDSRRATSETPT